jgi:hypothetical protein
VEHIEDVIGTLTEVLVLYTLSALDVMQQKQLDICCMQSLMSMELVSFQKFYIKLIVYSEAGTAASV